MTDYVIIALLALTLLGVIVLSVLIGRGRKNGEKGDPESLKNAIRDSETAIKAHAETLGRANADGLARATGQANEALLSAVKGISDGNEQRLVETRKETLSALEGVRRQLGEELEKVRTLMGENLANLRKEQEGALEKVRSENKEQMDAMRAVVEEKLQKTLNERLTLSFNAISERLEAVQKGLGEMRELSGGVSDLKRVLTNVKTRGTWGETSLEALLDDILTSEQYERNVAVSPRATLERVDFAVRLPAEGGELLLPIDVKFPVEDYQRLSDAESKEEEGEARKALIAAVKRQARKIGEKYVKPPRTTDFAIMYLPIEGLYGEVLREAGLVEMLQREYAVVPAGPSTISALLNTIRMGFRSLAIQKSSREIFDLMRDVAKQFDKILFTLQKVKDYVQKADDNLGAVASRSEKLRTTLRRVELLDPPSDDAPSSEEEGE